VDRLPEQMRAALGNYTDALLVLAIAPKRNNADEQ
jgi:hypothetical protein